MTGHLDDAEIDQMSPIYSFSLGLSCIFLIGGRTKDDKPISVRLDSGDLFSKSPIMKLWAYNRESATMESREFCPRHLTTTNDHK